MSSLLQSLTRGLDASTVRSSSCAAVVDAPSSPRLAVGLAIQEGWQTFRRSPWPFVFFAVAAFILSTLVDQLPGITGLIATTLVDLWASIGLMRGAWLGLNGKSPKFADFITINPAAIWRLFSRQLVLALLLSAMWFAFFWLALISADASGMFTELYGLVMATGPSNPDQITALLPEVQSLAMKVIQSPVAVVILLIGSLVVAYLQVNQAFLGYIAVVKGLGPIATIQQGITTVQGQWWTVLGLLVMQVLITFLGALACGFGLLAAIPVVFGVTASAYRQLFGDDDAAGFLNGH